MKYIYGQTRTGEAQHAVEVNTTGVYSRRAVCGARITNVYGPPFDGSRGIQHPWCCDKCNRKIKTEEV